MARADFKAKTAKPRAKRPARLPTERRLTNIATFYLKRFSSSAENLRRVLERRIYKMTLERPELRPDALRTAEAVVARLVAAGAVDDEAYALAKARTGRALKKPRAKIAAKLKAKGVAVAVIDKALDAESSEDDDFEAGLAIARRRRLGPFRLRRDQDTDRKDLAALARAGLDFKTAKRVMNWSED